MGSTVGDPFIGFGVCINSIPEHYAALTLSSIPLPASTIARTFAVSLLGFTVLPVLSFRWSHHYDKKRRPSIPPPHILQS